MSALRVPHCEEEKGVFLKKIILSDHSVLRKQKKMFRVVKDNTKKPPNVNEEMLLSSVLRFSFTRPRELLFRNDVKVVLK